MAKYTYILDGKEVPEDVWSAEMGKRRAALKDAGLDDGKVRQQTSGKYDPADVMAAHDQRNRVLYGYKDKSPVIEDYRSELAAKTWPRYKKMQMPDGTWREGPERFRTRAEEQDYRKTYGFVEY